MTARLARQWVRPQPAAVPEIEVTAMTKTAPFLLSLLTTSVLCSSVVAYAGQTSQSAQPATTSTPSSTSTTPSTSGEAAAAPANADGTLPVSIDRIKKALTVAEPAGPPIRREIAEGELPRFVVQTEAPRTIMLRGNYDKTNAVAAYVQPQFDYYHSEFLEMTTPDNYKGCGQFAGDQGACAQVMSSRVASGAIWQSVLRGMFKQPQPQQ
jgi:hypothetical protein